MHWDTACWSWFYSALASTAVVSLILVASLMGVAYSVKSHVLRRSCGAFTAHMAPIWGLPAFSLLRCLAHSSLEGSLWRQV